MKAFVTGGTGFIGGHVVRKLVNRGYEVYALIRSQEGAAGLRALGAQVVDGDIGHPDSMREGMRGSDVVFHLAGWYKIGSRDWTSAEAINVAGTRNVLRLAQELGVPRIVYTSTTSVFGDTGGKLVDENFFQGGPFVTEYDRTKWLAHYKVAVPLIEEGVPITIVIPGGIYGPDDHSLIGTLMENFYWGRMPAVPAPEFTITYAHVEDVAEGVILAAEKGRACESYILTGPAVPLGELVDFWGQITGKPVPLLRVPARFLLPLAPLSGAVGNFVRLPELFSEETIRIMGVSYLGRADKAREELGWKNRTLQIGMSETFRWIEENETPPKPLLAERERKVAGLALLAAALVLLLWLLGRRK